MVMFITRSHIKCYKLQPTHISMYRTQIPLICYMTKHKRDEKLENKSEALKRRASRNVFINQTISLKLMHPHQ